MICKRCGSDMTQIYKFWGSREEPSEEFHVCPDCNNEYEFNQCYGTWWLSDDEDTIEDTEEDFDENL